MIKILGVFVVCMVLVAFWAANQIDQRQAECEARGGIQVRTNEGYTCIKTERIELK